MMETMRSTRAHSKDRAKGKPATSLKTAAVKTYQPCAPWVQEHRRKSGESLGPGFSMIKLYSKQRSVHPSSEIERSPINTQNIGNVRNNSSVQKTIFGPLPSWLESAFVTLPSKHPLRSLVPIAAHEALSPEIHPSSDSTAVDLSKSSPGSSHSLFPLDPDDAPTSPFTLVFNSVYEASGSKFGTSGVQNILQEPLSLQPSTNGDALGPGNDHLRDLRLFTTPGPASTISQAFAPSPIAKTRFDINMFSSPGEHDHEGEAYHEEEIMQPSIEEAEGNGIFKGKGHAVHSIGYEGKKNTQRPLLHCEEFLYELEQINPPGITYRPVYFDSLLEDCLDFEPSMEPHALDISELDFRWTRFDRGGPSQWPNPVPSVETDYDQSLSVVTQVVPLESTDRQPSPDSEDRFHFQAALDETQTKTPADADRERRHKALAPAPGIFLPLLQPSASGTHSPPQSRKESRDSIGWSS
ncbi:hypothetical protein NP233_g4062 [Leucocoprinus birnbaumii]|uniref:Uncharacterized protein n=1 Tax=Leucocoprinus birnbaumii TaxID=56174 RepID=A0AAD5VWT5_9AGAR|nr:hypothetical protein NP233_g4062 [Leucocoprinus birnbaumii]